MSVAPHNGSTISRFNSLRASVLFPGRKTLYVFEFGDVFKMTINQVISLIEEDVISAIRINGAGNSSARSNYRIPVSEYDRYLLQGGNKPNGKAVRS